MFITAYQGGAAPAAVSKLEKTSNGEYTAGSVAMNLSEALRMMLTRQEDGNYTALNSPLYRSSNAVRSAMLSLSIGG